MIEIGGRRARGCGKARGRELRVALLATSILGAWASAAAAQPAPVLPSGGAVAAGSAVISGGGSTLTVSQGSAKAIVNWDSFSIGAGGAVRFDNGAGATLNRVKGGDLSQIDGLLSASGSVYLINPNGVLVGKTGVVNTGGSFVASTLDIADKDFLAGGALSFAGDSRAAVVNYGKIGSLGGDIALIASTVSNTGAINAANGDVGLLAGRRVVLRDLALDNGKFAVELGGGDTSATNAGTIEGAMAELRANGGNVYALAGNVGSIIKATGVSARDGKVFLVAEGGALEASGAVSARAAGGAGGFVETSGETLKTDGLTVDAGAGGRWLLDPATLTIDPALAGTINATLAGGTNVTQQADNSLTVAAPLGWSTGAALTLTSGGTLAINAPITVSGAGQFTLVAAPTSPANLTISAPVEFGATAIAGQVLTINGQAYTLIRDRNGLEAAGGNGSYALATSLDLSGKTYGGAVIGSISGTFEGLGHTISNVTINAPFANLVGLFAISYGTIRDVGLIGGSVIGSQSVGGLVGYQGGGAIVNAFATGAVSGNSDVGGLVGFQAGSIDSSYAAGTVRGNVEVGGLAGLQTGSITNAYATGAVSGSSLIGGLVGEQEGGSITSAYATGAVSGNGNLGGLVGYQRGGSAANAFWDVTTTGQSTSAGGGVGVTTAQLASATTLAALGGGGAVWGNADNQTTPYLLANLGPVYLASDASATPTAYQPIISAAGLQAVEASEGGNYVLANNLDLGGITYGRAVIYLFNGTFDGLGHTIANLTINAQYATDVGLFGLSSGTIRNVGLIGGSVAGDTLVGALVGAQSGGTIVNAYAAATVSGNREVGGLVGEQTGGSIIGAYATGAVNGNQQVGGLVGFQGGSIDRSYAANTVRGTLDIGGLVGLQIGSITNAYATGVVSSSSGANLGGLVGRQYSGSISNAYATGSVSASSSYNIGGLVGEQDSGSITSAYATGAVSGHLAVGGLVGDQVGGLIVNAYATAAVSGVGSSFYLGGLVGRQDNGSIVNAYAVGAVSGSTDVGGLVGEQNGGSIANAYATGAVSGRFDAGGLVGAAFGGSIANTFWDAGATGQQVGAGFGAIGGATGVTTAQLHSLATLAAAGWSIDGQGGTASVWRIYDGQTAPLLRSFLQPLDISGLAATAAYNGQAQATAGPAVTLLGAAAIGVHAGTYTSSYYSTQQGYDLIGQAELTIAPAMLTASLVGSTSKTYDGTTAATLSGANFQLAGVIGQDPVALTTPTSGSFDAVHVGAGKTVSASGLALANNSFGDYQLAATGVSAAIGTITPATLTASLIGATSKTYDGITTATLSGANFKLMGVIGQDTVGLATPNTGAFDTIHVGNGKTVSAVGLTLANNTFGDYQLAATGVSASIGAITPATLTASLIGSTSKTYDGITTATLSGVNFKLVGVIGQDAVALTTPSAGSFDTVHVGTGKTVSAAGLTLANNAFGDYRLAAGGVSAAIGAITPATLTASLIGATSKTYDGTTTATLTSANFKLAGVIGQDAVALTAPSNGSFDTVHVGTGKTVSAAGLTLANNAFGDYRLAAGGVSAAIGAITPATLTASLIGATSKTYDGTTTATLTSTNFKLAGVIGQDAVALTTPSTGSFDTANAGSGKTVTANGLGLGNNAFGDYRLASTTIGGAMGRIDPRALSVSLTGSVNKVYDDTTVATLGGGNFTLTGVLGADNVTVATTNGTYATANVAYAIPVAVSGLQLGGAASKNYALNTTSLSAAIGTISPFILRATLLSLPADALRWAQLSLQAPGDYGLTLASPLGDLAIIAPPINKYASR